MKKIISIVLLILILLLPVGVSAKQNIDNETLTIDGEKVTVSIWYERWHEINNNKYYTVGTDLKTGWWRVVNKDDNGKWTKEHKTDWYYFDNTGKMLTNAIIDGYIINADGTGIYGINHNDISKGQKGQMATTIVPINAGWQLINGKWYYFNSDLTMAINTTTQDGYKIGADGVWIQ